MKAVPAHKPEMPKMTLCGIPDKYIQAPIKTFIAPNQPAQSCLESQEKMP